jgi:hypothetical protein
MATVEITAIAEAVGSKRRSLRGSSWVRNESSAPPAPAGSLLVFFCFRFVVFSAAMGRFVSDAALRSKPPADHVRKRPRGDTGYAREMLGRTAILVIPTVAVAVTALVLLGPGAVRPAVGVRLCGVPLAGGRVVALRLAALKSLYGIEEGTAVDGLQVNAIAAGARLGAWSGDADQDGIAEVRLDAAAPIEGPLSVLVTRHGVVLAQGTIPLRPADPIPFTPRRGLLVGSAQGDLRIQIEAMRGVLAAPFPETLALTVTEILGDAPVQADLDITALGAELARVVSTPSAAPHRDPEAAPFRLTTNDRGVARIVVKPLAHDVTLTVTAKTLAKAGRWEGLLPVLPGAAWIDPAGGPGALTIVSPAPHGFAYLSFWSEEGRVAGATLPLVKDADGFYRARVVPQLPAAARLLYVSVAGDPQEQGAGTVAWPLRPAEGAVTPRAIELLLDGMPAANALEAARAWAARRAGLAVLAAAALTEILLLLYRSRVSQQKLEAHFLEGEPEGSPERPGLLRAAREHRVLRVLVGVAMIALAFAIIGALTSLRMR